MTYDLTHHRRHHPRRMNSEEMIEADALRDRQAQPSPFPSTLSPSAIDY